MACGALALGEAFADVGELPHSRGILRHCTDLKTGTVSRQTVYTITDLSSQEASPERLGETLDNRSGETRPTASSFKTTKRVVDSNPATPPAAQAA
ncbi:hypothetical protein GCM10010524_13930 [Streptomyces mexicanus]